MKLVLVERKYITTLMVFFDVMAFILIITAIFTPGWRRIEYTQTVVDFPADKPSKTEIGQTSEIPFSTTVPGLEKLKMYFGYRKKHITVKLSFSIFYVKTCTSEICLSLELSDVCTKHFDSCSDGSPSYMSILAEAIVCLITIICGFAGSVLFYVCAIKKPDNLPTNPTVLKGGFIAVVITLIGAITGLVLLIQMQEAISKVFDEIAKMSDLSHFRELSQYSVTMMTIGIVVMFIVSVYHVIVIWKLYKGDNLSSTGILLQTYQPPEYNRLED